MQNFWRDVVGGSVFRIHFLVSIEYATCSEINYSYFGILYVTI